MKATPFYFFILPPSEFTSKSSRSTWRMSVDHAAAFYPGAVPMLNTVEMRMLPENDDEMARMAHTSHLQTGAMPSRWPG